MQLRDYQREAVEFLVPRRRAFVQAPAGSGKTIIAAEAVARRAWPGCRVVWLTNTLEQTEQGIAAIEKTAGPENVSFTVCCVAARPDTTCIDILVTDEAHHAGGAATWIALLEKARPECIVWGFSATPWSEEEERNEKLRELFSEFLVVDRARVEASGHLAKAKVFFHDIDRPGQFDDEIARATEVETIRRCRKFPMVAQWEHRRRAQWAVTLEFLKNNLARNAHICHVARSSAEAGKSVLVLVQSIEHGQTLAAGIAGAEMAFSKMGAKKRKSVIDRFKSGELKVLIATSLADEGLDVVRAGVLILAAGGRAKGKVEQRTGRVLRPFEGKVAGEIHDYCDNGAMFAAAQAFSREKTYRSLGYEVVHENPLEKAA